MRVGVAERAETVIILLSGRIPQRELNVFPINFNIGNIVLEHGGNINLADNISYQDTKMQCCARPPQEAYVCRLPESGCD